MPNPSANGPSPVTAHPGQSLSFGRCLGTRPRRCATLHHQERKSTPPSHHDDCKNSRLSDCKPVSGVPRGLPEASCAATASARSQGWTAFCFRFPERARYLSGASETGFRPTPRQPTLEIFTRGVTVAMRDYRLRRSPHEGALRPGADEGIVRRDPACRAPQAPDHRCGRQHR